MQIILVVTDLGNSKIWKEINVGIDEGQKFSFTHQSDNDLKVFKSIFVFLIYWNLLGVIT